MSDSFISIVATNPEVSQPEQKANLVLEWLQEEDIVSTVLGDCTLGDHGYDIGPKAKNWVLTPEYLPNPGGVSGLEITIQKKAFDPVENYEDGMQIAESNLGFTFWNWQEFTNDFMSKISALTGENFTTINGRI